MAFFTLTMCISTGLIISCITAYSKTASTDLTLWERSRARRSAEKNLIAGVDRDSSLISQSNMDLPWEQFIVSGPATVNLLGQLMVVSSKHDFSFQDFMPDYKFVYMRFPRSFRATLTQIANDGWEAFMGAHNNMNKIQASMELVPRQVKTALTVLASQKSTPKIISMLLPTTLREIERLGKTCVTYANATHVNFVTVMNLIGEVISMTETARGLQETKLRQTEIELNVSLVMKEEYTKLGQTIRQHYDEARNSVRKAQDEYSSALRKIPTGFKGLLMDLGRAVIGIVQTAGQSFIGRGSATQPAVSLSSGQTLTFAKLFSDALNKAVPGIKKIIDINNETQSESKNPIKELEAYKITFETFLSSVAAGKAGQLKEQASESIRKGINLVDQTISRMKKVFANGENATVDAVNNLKGQFDELIEEVKPMVAAEKMNGGGVPPSGSASTSTGDSSQNEKFVAQLSLDRLQSAESRYDKIFGDLKQNQEELAKLMGKIASLDMNRIQYKEILELMREALHLLAKVREQWGQLVLFFAEVATRAEITLSGTLGPFITQASQAGSESLTLDERLFYVDLLKAQAGDIDSQTQMLYLMSRTYVDMSTHYIMGRLAGLSKMLLARDDNERNSFLAQLVADTRTNQQAVMDLVVQRKNNYQTAIQKRRIELERFVAKLGGPDADDQAAIEAGKALLARTS
ncbi:unnamed protein product [Rotaria socialis]|uniref:Uncharacterized protein n=2 Tax=Rotaria socialis TaxID=392032 RepID=A0A817TH77_9BILA|nr:unnamed protein product [Rotaria socialis]CAF3381405.1 unnamed protein product [Rotaria socialis]CAF3564604.1 unnamed protein product [Rotaria socialis]CAF4094822.1 unnamed protein product [Rotaria socialis]CAF4480252.1 unnamed protein product [Rotaria socialis]